MGLKVHTLGGDVGSGFQVSTYNVNLKSLKVQTLGGKVGTSSPDYIWGGDLV